MSEVGRWLIVILGLIGSAIGHHEGTESTGTGRLAGTVPRLVADQVLENARLEFLARLEIASTMPPLIGSITELKRGATYW